MTAPARSSARQWLRAATAADHTRVDAAFAGFDLRGHEGYCAFMRAQADAFFPVETAIDRSEWGELLEDWPSRRRAHLLRADLGALGLSTVDSGDVPIFHGAGHLLGAVYVLEGSRLGGRLLARSIAADLPRQFVAADDVAPWRRLIEVLDATLISAPLLAAAKQSACQVFARFEASAHRHKMGGAL